LADQKPHPDQRPDGLGDDSLPVREEPLDPASQSLADALRASFRILKGVMILVVLLFLGSGLFIVDEQKEAVVLLRFGKETGVYTKDLHWAWPYPVDEVVRIPTAPKTLAVDAFWLNIRDQDKGKNLSELMPRGSGLDPAVDGALLTGDRGIMHLLLQVQYRITDPELFVRNVLASPDKDEAGLLRPVLQNAAVAGAARTTADVLWKDPERVVGPIRSRAQAVLDMMGTGITLENVAADKSYFPLQVKDAVLNVSQAEQQQREAIQKAKTQQEKTLNQAAGQAWQKLRDEIEKLDQLTDGPERQQVFATIGDILVSEAAGEAGEKIKGAELQLERIVEDTQARVNEFQVLLHEYRLSPRLFRQRELKDMLRELYAQPGVTKWILPPGLKQIVLWLNRDPKEIKQAQEERMREKAKGKRK